MVTFWELFDERQAEKASARGRGAIGTTTLEAPARPGAADHIIRAILERLRLSEVGTRNGNLNTAAFTIGGFVATDCLKYEDARRQLEQVGYEIGLDRREVSATVRSGLTAGRERPLHPDTYRAPESFDVSDLDLEEDGAAPAAAERRHSAAIAFEVNRLRVLEEAKRIVHRDASAQQDPPAVQSLDAFLAVEDEPESYRVRGLWPTGGRIVLSAQYKAGKTTMIGNLIRSLVDDEPFLGRFDVTPLEGRVVLIDDELDERMLRRWLREQDIEATSRTSVVSLRGRVGTFDLLDLECRKEWSATLREAEASVVVLDCLRPVMDALGLDENKDAGRFLVAFDAMLYDAGLSEAVVVHHMGHNGERSRVIAASSTGPTRPGGYCARRPNRACRSRTPSATSRLSGVTSTSQRVPSPTRRKAAA